MVNAIGAQLRDLINNLGLARWRLTVSMDAVGRTRERKRTRFSLGVVEIMSWLTRDGTAGPVSRFQLTTRRIGDHNIRLIRVHTLPEVMAIRPMGIMRNKYCVL